MIHARNKGFNSAKHEIIARCDADVILPKDWIEKRLRGIAVRQELTEEWKNRDIKEEKEFEA